MTTRIAALLSLLAVILTVFSGNDAAATTVCSVAGAGRQLDTGVGGTGIDTGQGGTGIDTGNGGTGLQADVGTGGTGIQRDTGTGGTGIVGVITGFGSICVNGTEVEYNAATPVDNNGARSNANELKVGQVVAVLAKGHGERVFAQHIAVRDALLGPVTRTDLANGVLEVMNQRVHVDAGTIMGSARLSNVRTGEFVRISGFQTNNGVFASRIDTAAAGQVRLTGTVSTASTTHASVNGLNVELSSAQPPAPKSEVTVIGQWQGNGIRAAHVDVLPSTPFSGRAEYLSVQGRVGQRFADGSYQIGAMRVQLPPNVHVEGGTTAALRTDDLCQIEGRVSADKVLHAERVIVGDRLPRPDNARGDEQIRHGKSQSDQDSSSDSNSSNGHEAESKQESTSHGGDANPDHSGRDNSTSRSGHDSNQESKSDREQMDRIEKDAREQMEKIERERIEQQEKIQRDELKQIEEGRQDHSGKSN